MHDALAACAEHLSSFGGHAMAGGLRLPARGIGDFARAFTAYAAERLTPEMLTASLSIDAEASLGELTYPVVEHLERLGPFGQGNPRPLVAVRSCRVLRPAQRMGRNGATVSFVVGQETASPGPGRHARMRCVGFGMGDLADTLAGVNLVDIAGEPVLNRFNNRTSVEMRLRDVVRA
jgi:single-stranded-DNA-specific exonuclease